MKIIFDPDKDAINTNKHGVSLQDANQFEWNTAISWPDQRHQYGENRMVGIGYIGHRLFVIVFVDRDGMRRIISLRKANKREEKMYAET